MSGASLAASTQWGSNSMMMPQSRKISPPNYAMKSNGGLEHSTQEPDPGQLLNEWLGELDNLQRVSDFL